jgi:hypothetical protein
MEKEIEIDGKTYIIDIKRAIEQKLLCPTLKKHDLQYGDVFRNSTYKDYMVIIPFGYNRDQLRYYVAGCRTLILQPFSVINESYEKNGFTKEEMLDYLQRRSYEFVANINVQIEELLKLVQK